MVDFLCHVYETNVEHKGQIVNFHCIMNTKCVSNWHC